MARIEPQQRIGFVLILVGVIGLVALRWLDQLNAPEKSPAFPSGVVRVAIDPSVPPFASFTTEGELVGIDVDLARALAQEIGLPIQIEPMGIDALFDALATDRADLVISAINPEAWRMGDVGYTRAYFDAGLVLVSNHDNPLESMRDLPGQSLALEFGSTAAAEASSWQRRIPSFVLRNFERPTSALDAVRLRQADAALVDAVTLRLYLRDHTDWRPHTTSVTSQGLVIAASVKHPETLRRADAALQHLLESGVVAQILSRWL